MSITGLRAVSVPVNSQDDALDFYVDRLGFTLVRDLVTPNGRWIELAPGDASVVITLEPATPGALVARSRSDSPPATPMPRTRR